MKRITGALLLIAALVLPLTACTGHPAPSDAAVSKWYRDTADSALPAGVDVIGLGGGTSGPDDHDAAADGISLSPADDTPVRVTGFLVRCYGAGSLPVRYTVTTARDSTTESHRMPCDKKPHTIDFEANDVTEVTVNGLQTPSATGWYITALGYSTPTDAQVAAWADAAAKKLASDAPPHTVIAALLGASPKASADASSASKVFAPAISLRTVRVSCYGAPSMTILLNVSAPIRAGATESHTIVTPPVPCDKKPHTIEISEKKVAKVELSGRTRTGTVDASYLVYLTGS